MKPRSSVSASVSLAAALLLVPPAGVSPAAGLASKGEEKPTIQLAIKVASPRAAVLASVVAAYNLVLDDSVLASRGIYLVHASDSKARFDAKKASDLAKKLASSDDVVFAEINDVIHVDDTQFSGWPYGEPADAGSDRRVFTEQPLAARLELDAAHELSRGPGTVVAVLDTGLDVSHPALAGRVEQGWNYVADDADTRDLATGVDSNKDGVPDDAVGHGTFVAGLVSLVAPQARIAPYKVLDSDGVGNTYLALQAIWDATADGVDVINLSFGTPAKSRSPLLAEAIKAAEKAGVVVVAAAGNDGNDQQHYPAAQAEVLSVSALDASTLAGFSCRGKWVDIGAPGVDVVGPLPGGRYARWAGTSTSAPLVSGLAALMRAVAPKMKVSKLRDAVKKTGRELPKGPKGSKVGDLPRALDVVAALERVEK